MAGAAIFGLFVIFKDNEYFRIKYIPDNTEARQMINQLGLFLEGSVESAKVRAVESLAKNDNRSNIV